MGNSKDLYLQFDNFYQRLEKEYQKYGRLIIAVDFDDTIFDTYHHGQENFEEMISLLKRWQNHSKIILWSCSLPERYPIMIEFCNSYGLRVDAINENVEPVKYDHLNHCRKIYANVYLDDRAGMLWAKEALEILIDKITREDDV
jgi:hypothetical protein